MELLLLGEAFVLLLTATTDANAPERYPKSTQAIFNVLIGVLAVFLASGASSAVALDAGWDQAPPPFSPADSVLKEVTITPSYETAGVIVRLDRDPNGVDVRLEVRKQGESMFRPQHAFVRYDARHMATSLFDLQPNTSYTAKIIDGQHEILQSFSTKAPFSVPSPLRVVNVDDRAQLVNALADAQAGDQIVVAQGTYTGGFLVENKHGTAQHPIVIKGNVSASDLSKPITQRKSLPIIRNAHLHPVSGMETGLLISGSSHVIVDGLRFERNQRSGLRLDNSKDCVVQNSQLFDNGAYTQPAMLIYEGGAYAGQHLIQNNYFYENVNRSDPAEYGLVNDYDPGPGTVMRGNVFVGFQNAIAPCTNEDSTQNVSVNDMDVLADWPINDIEVYDNDFIDIDGDAIEADGICINARIYRNRVSGHITYSPISIAPALPGPIFFVRNIVSAAHRGSAVKFNTATGRGTIRNIFFYHNTFMRTQETNTDWGALSFWDGTPSENIVFKNNIITSVDKLSTIQEEWTHKPAMDYNLWYSSLGINAPVFVYWGNPGFAVGWEDWKTLTGYEAHGVWGQPKLDGNFRPANGSPAIDKGDVIPGINNSYSGSAPDIGAVESVGSRTSPVFDVKANGVDEPSVLARETPLSVTISLDTGGTDEVNGDLWMVASTPVGIFWYTLDRGWVSSGKLVVLYSGPFFSFSSYEVLNLAGLPTGAYTFYFVGDLRMNGDLDAEEFQYDSVSISIR